METVVWEVAKYVLWKAERMWKAKEWRVTFGGEGDDGYRVSDRIWADNCWTCSDDREKLTWMVNDSTDELMDLTWSPSWSRCGGRVRTQPKMV